MTIFKLILPQKWEDMLFSSNHNSETLNYRDMKLIEVMSLLKCLRKNHILEYNFLISCIHHSEIYLNQKQAKKSYNLFENAVSAMIELYFWKNWA